MPRNGVKTFNSPRMQRRRLNLGWSREKLASESSLSTATIAQLELGNRCPSPDALSRIASALDVTYAELVR